MTDKMRESRLAQLSVLVRTSHADIFGLVERAELANDWRFAAAVRRIEMAHGSLLDLLDGQNQKYFA